MLALGVLVAGVANAQAAEPVADSGDTAWMLVASALVLLMTPGLALFYGGMVRRKNVLATFMYSFFALALVTVQWVLFGYSLAFGKTHGGLIGGGDFLLLENVSLEAKGSIPHLVFMAFQLKFAIITPALISGAFVERMKFSAYALFILLWTTLVYDPVAHWTWAEGGWLLKLGVLDFAGGTVVHWTAGLSALLGKQALAVLAVGAYTTVVTLLLLKVVDKVLGLRVTEEEERMGLDSTQHGEAAYTS